MLILTRRIGEKILIGDDIIITVLDINHDASTSIGIDAPVNIKILRKEVAERDKLKTINKLNN